MINFALGMIAMAFLVVWVPEAPATVREWINAGFRWARDKIKGQ